MSAESSVYLGTGRRKSSTARVRLISGSGKLSVNDRKFETYFTHNRNPSDPEVLAEAAAAAGLDPSEAREVLTSGRYADEVRRTEEAWRAAGINSVPAVVVNQRYLISGGQPPETFEQALRQIADQA